MYAVSLEVNKSWVVYYMTIISTVAYWAGSLPPLVRLWRRDHRFITLGRDGDMGQLSEPQDGEDDSFLVARGFFCSRIHGTSWGDASYAMKSTCGIGRSTWASSMSTRVCRGGSWMGYWGIERDRMKVHSVSVSIKSVFASPHHQSLWLAYHITYSHQSPITTPLNFIGSLSLYFQQIDTLKLICVGSLVSRIFLSKLIRHEQSNQS